MTMLILLFTNERGLIGEVETARKRLKQITLTPLGEQSFGARIRLWQTRGVPVNKTMKTTSSDGQKRDLIFFKEYVQPSSPLFEEALLQWASDLEIVAITVDDDLVEYWKRIAALPLEQEEQFALLLALKHTPPALITEWQRALADAELFSRHRREDARLAVQSLKRRVSGHLMGPFVNKKNIP